MLFPTSLTIPPPTPLPPTATTTHTFPIGPNDDALITKWARLRPRIVQIIDDLNWCSLGVFNIGPTEETARPTIVIGAENVYADSVRAGWEKARGEIEKVVKEGVGVVVWEDRIGLMAY